MLELPTVVPRIENRNWSKLSQGERIRQIEVEGYVLIPDVLSKTQVSNIKKQVSNLPTQSSPYSENQRGLSNIMFQGGDVAEIAAHPTIIGLLKSLLGEDIICMSGSYARTQPGHPGMVLHTDIGNELSPHSAVRVLFYLIDTTPEISPFRVLPRSNLSLHTDGNPYKRYLEHPDEVMVMPKAGSAIIITNKVFHGNYPNKSDKIREMIAYMYRPGWCAPTEHVEPWDPDELSKLPKKVRELFGDPNTKYGDFHNGSRPPNMAKVAPGISPNRWD